MKRASGLLVIGVGNRYRGDDAAGPVVAESLLEEFGAESVATCDGDPGALIDLWSGRREVVLIDAMISGGSAGTIQRFDVSENPLPAEDFPVSTHAFGLAGSIELARGMSTLPASVVIYGIEAEQFERGAAMSPRVRASVWEVSRKLARRLRAAPPRERSHV